MNLFTPKVALDFFNDYVEHESTKVMTYQGFLKFLALEKKLDPSSLRDMKKMFENNLEILSYIKTICEGDLVDQSLLGTINGNMSQFILKHKHGYETEADTNVPTAPVINIINEG